MNYPSLFCRDSSFVHLNAGSLTRTPSTVIEFMENFRKEAEKNPTRSLFLAPALFDRLHRLMASEFAAEPEDLFFRSNVTTALNDFLFAVPLKGKEILVTAWEYGATENLSRSRAIQENLALHRIPLPMGENVSAKEIEERIVARVTEDTALVVLSHIATGLGTILPLETLVPKLQAKGCVVVVDGAHAPGAIDVSLTKIGADFYGGNLHKWFLGPRGTAFGWVHPKWKGKIPWKFGGWASFSVPSHFEGVLKDPEAARRFFPGTMDEAPFAALEKVVEFWNQWGRETLRKKQKELRDQCLRNGLAMGWRRLSPKDNWGPLLTFELPDPWKGVPNLAHRLYKEAKVQVALPNVDGTQVLRFSPGIYVSEEEIDIGFERLKEWRP